MMTTLYVHVQDANGNVLYTGMEYIDEWGVLALVLSFEFVGQGSDADKLSTLAVRLMSMLLRSQGIF